MQYHTARRHLRIGLVCEGNAATSETAFSGTAKGIFSCLTAEGHKVTPVDASLHGFRKALTATASFSGDRTTWRSRYRYGSFGAHCRTAASESSLGKKAVDVVLQIGPTYEPPCSKRIPYALYCDWNVALDIAEAEQNGAAHLRGLSLHQLRAIDRKHASRYRNARMIFTISEKLRQSFLDFYKLPADRVRTAYAGPNLDLSLVDTMLERPKRTHRPTVLFIAKEFHRKGGDIVAAAFVRLRQTLPHARLLFAGTRELPPDFRGLENIEHLGVLNKSNPQQLQELLEAYREADVLVLPSRNDPFPTVIREAMFFGLPCIASDIWAMPEMIENGKTGFLVPSQEPEALAHRLLQLFANTHLLKRMGRAARTRAEQLFSWGSVGKMLSEGLNDAF